MRRMMGLICLAAALMLAACGRAETWLIEGGEWVNLWWTAETFEGAPEAELTEALARSAFVGDAVIRGARMTMRYKYNNQVGQDVALLAVNHAGMPMLVALVCQEGWQVRPVSETFLRMGQDFGITVTAHQGVYGTDRCYLTVTYGEEQYAFYGNLSPWQLIEYRCGQDVVRYDVGSVIAYHMEEETRVNTFMKSEDFLLPVYAEAIRADSYPVTAAALEAWVAEHPLTLAADEAYVSAANLRQQATGGSRSLGVLTHARARVLGSAQGKDLPWYHVRVGDTEGWVSGAYCAVPGNSAFDARSLCWAANTLIPVARARSDTPLLDAPGGTQKAALPAGTVGHVLLESDGWLMVIIPAGEQDWLPDWTSGTVGYIRRDQADVAQSALYLKYEVTEP